MTTAERVTITEAAQRLGVSADTVQRRLKRGELLASKEPTPQGFRWLVQLPEGAPADAGADGAADTPATAPAPEGSAPPQASERTGAEVRRLEELVAAYRAQLDAQRAIYERQVADQAEELAARRREVSELHVLLQQAQRALPTPPQGQDGAPAGTPAPQGQTESPRRAWWRFWRRDARSPRATG